MRHVPIFSKGIDYGHSIGALNVHVMAGVTDAEGCAGNPILATFALPVMRQRGTA